MRLTIGLSGKRSDRKKWDLTRSKKADSDVMGCNGKGGIVDGRPRTWAACAGLSSFLVRVGNRMSEAKSYGGCVKM